MIKIHTHFGIIASILLISSDALAQTIDQVSREELSSAVNEMIAIHSGELSQDSQQGMSQPPDISTCDFYYWGSHSAKHLSEHIDTLARLTYSYVRIYNELSNSEYPIEAWKPALDRQILTQSRRSADGLGVYWAYESEKVLASVLDGYDRNLGRDRPYESYLANACGGDSDFGVRVVTDPPGAAVYVMSVFDAKYCNSMGITPFSGNCEGYLLPPERPISSGTYAFRIIWPDSSEACDHTEFFGGAHVLWDDAPRITLAPPRGICNQSAWF